MAPEVHDIPALQRQLENVEDNDEEAHKLYNNLGVAYSAARQYRAALSAHRLEKRACRRLSNLHPGHAGRLIDLAIAYRRCGDAMLRLNAVQVKGNVIKERKMVFARAHQQHVKGLQIARDADPTLPSSRVEVQAACAAVAQSALQYAQETGDHADIKRACGFIAKAAALAEGLGPSDRVSTKKKRVMLHSAAVNFGIALSTLGDRRRAKAMLEAAAVRAKAWGDAANHARAVSNLADEARLAKDWETCEKYVALWLAYATSTRDEAEESDALQRLGIALFEQYRITEARDALQRSLLLAKEDSAKKEARKNLLLVEIEIEEVIEAADKLAVIEQGIPELTSSEKFVEEAKSRISAGELAFRLRKKEDVIMHLERYFELVDNYSCDPEVTGVAKPNHFTAVANLAEAFWLMKNYPKAVHWATRELTSYGDDIGGQAQAWCNLGVYLSDSGKKEEALEALNRSIELAKIADDLDIAKKAEDNIDILQTESEKATSTGEGVEFVPDARTDAALPVEDRMQTEGLGDAAALLPRFSKGADANRSQPCNAKSDCQPENAHTGLQPRNANSRSNPINAVVDLTDDGQNVLRVPSRENSIVVTSGEPGGDQRFLSFPPTFGTNFSGTQIMRRDANGASSAAYSYSKPREPREIQSRSNFSRGWSGVDRSSAGTRKYVDVASVYKKLCASDSHRPVNARHGILEVLRAASASVLTSADVENGTECVSIDLAGCFIGDRELAYLFKALAAFGNFKPISFNLGQNPLLSDAGYRCFAGEVRMSSCANIRVLNLSCAGVDSKALQLIASATQTGRGLGQVRELCLSKNGLGRQAVASAEACAALFLSDSCLEFVDLSFNLFSCAFFTKLVHTMKSRKGGSNSIGGSSTLKHVDFKLNNRRNPTAMLEFERGTDAVECFRELMGLMPAIESIDVRSCGASFHVRRALYSFARGADCLNKIVIASPGIFDDAAT